MGHPGFNRQWSRHAEAHWAQHRPWGAGPDGPGSSDGPERGFGRPGRHGTPPWISGLFGFGESEHRRGPRVRRGDVRHAILDVLRSAALAEESINGYQVIQQIADRSGGAWRPSPGSVYPTVQQLEDEGLVSVAEGQGRRVLGLTGEGTTYVEQHADELAGVWAPFESPAGDERDGRIDVKPEISQVMGAVWQIVSTGSEAQRRAALEILVDTRRRLYGVLADGPGPEEEPGS